MVMPKTNKSAAKTRSKRLSYEWRRIAYFFQWFSVDSSKEQLWEMLKLALTSEDEDGDLKKRSNMLNFYEHATEFIENIYTLLKEQAGSSSKKDTSIS
jgi:hypothetical protein